MRLLCREYAAALLLLRIVYRNAALRLLNKHNRSQNSQGKQAEYGKPDQAGLAIVSR